MIDNDPIAQLLKYNARKKKEKKLLAEKKKQANVNANLTARKRNAALKNGSLTVKEYKIW